MKACHTVGLSSLLPKRNSCGISGITYSWFKSCLSHTKQFLEIELEK